MFCALTVLWLLNHRTDGGVETPLEAAVGESLYELCQLIKAEHLQGEGFVCLFLCVFFQYTHPAQVFSSKNTLLVCWS